MTLDDKGPDVTLKKKKHHYIVCREEGRAEKQLLIIFAYVVGRRKNLTNGRIDL